MKKITILNNLLFFIILFSIMTSCKQQEEEKIEPADTTGLIMPSPKALESSEVSIAKKICRAFSRKLSSFRGPYLGSEFTFKRDRMNCGVFVDESVPMTLRVSINNISEDLMFTSGSRGRYFNSIYTNQSKPFNEICSKVLNDERPTNTYDQINGVEKVKVRFLMLEGYPSFQLTYFVKNESGNYISSRVEESLIYTGDNNGTLLSGMNVRRTELTDCPISPGSQSLFRQTLDF